MKFVEAGRAITLVAAITFSNSPRLHAENPSCPPISDSGNALLNVAKQRRIQAIQSEFPIILKTEGELASQRTLSYLGKGLGYQNSEMDAPRVLQCSTLISDWTNGELERLSGILPLIPGALLGSDSDEKKTTIATGHMNTCECRPYGNHDIVIDFSSSFTQRELLKTVVHELTHEKVDGGKNGELQKVVTQLEQFWGKDYLTLASELRPKIESDYKNFLVERDTYTPDEAAGIDAEYNDWLYSVKNNFPFNPKPNEFLANLGMMMGLGKGEFTKWYTQYFPAEQSEEVWSYLNKEIYKGTAPLENPINIQ